MIKIIDQKDIEESFYKGRDFGGSIDIVQTVLNDVRKKKDAALKEYGTKFDVSSPLTFEIPKSELENAAQKMKNENPHLYDSLCLSRDLALKFAKKQRECFNDFEIEISDGVWTGQKNIPVESAGVYVPAGRFPLLSSVIMTVVPAVAAGVKEIILCTPPRVHPADLATAQKNGLGISGKPFIGGLPYADEGIMATAFLCGAHHVYACGGAQAIGAMAFGTESIPKVCVIVGPGNKFVAEAKRLVYGEVGIDMLAGPTEVFIIADSSSNVEWVSSDLLAQAEHDIVAQPILATPSREFALVVQAEIERQMQTLPTKKIARESIDNFGKIIITKSLDEAAEVANKKAPEHLELALTDGADLERLKNQVHNYGSLFIGHFAAEVLGDYSAGLNHTLPTSGAARFTGGLSVRAFIKTVTTLRTKNDSKGMKECATAAGFLGDAEGLSGHARAARVRLGEKIK